MKIDHRALKILKLFQKTKSFILDTLFPIHCLSCQKEGSFICADCLQKIPLLSFQVCPKCEKLMTESGRLCAGCRREKPPLDALVAAVKYKDNHISKLVHFFKYNFAADLSVPLGALLAKIILKNNLPLPDIIIPVPLHQRRLRWRGFNQAELLANYVSENLTPGFTIQVFSNLIIRQKYTPPQMKIGKYAERRKNIRNAFTVNRKYFISEKNRLSEFSCDSKKIKMLENKKILLIDDIATTGATLFECAKVLKQNGAKKVFGAVIARQEFE